MGAILEHVSLPEAVGRALRRRILNNELPAETRLVEANLAAEFGVSRGTIRDAMRSLQAEGLIAIVPAPVQRGDPDVAGRRRGRVLRPVRAGGRQLRRAVSGPNRKELVRNLRLALEHMSVAARTDDMDALVASDTRFHELLIDVSGRRRLKDLWSMLNSQMGALMREEIERQGISLLDAVERHRGIFDAVSDGDLARLRRELRAHYLTGFPRPERSALAPSPPDRAGDT